MANPQPSDDDDFLEQILSLPAAPMIHAGGGGLSPFVVSHGQAAHHGAGVGPGPLSLVPCSRGRARRGQATDPHSIAERLRRERIAQRMRALQKLVPNSNKTDSAAMLDEIIDYVRFLRLQVKVLSMSRLSGASAVAQPVAEIPLQSAEVEAGEDESQLSNDGTEQQLAKFMEEDIGAAMRFLQSKGMCLMPISLAAAIFPSHDNQPPLSVKPESNAPS